MLLRVAATILHEAWHLSHGGSEQGAYAAQLTLLIANHGAPDQIAAVRMGREYALAADQKAIDAAKRLSNEHKR